MDKNYYITRILDFFTQKKWIIKSSDEKIVIHKFDTPYFINSKRFKDIQCIYDIIYSELKMAKSIDVHIDSIINSYGNTDYIIAGLQALDLLMKNNENDIYNDYYYFQPVIRSVKSDLLSQDGVLPCFVNVGTLSISHTIQKYFDNIELWLTILSKCSIHAGTITFIVKKNTNAFDGIGLKAMVGEKELGQFNLYEKEILGNTSLIIDIGFGLERICWVSNGYKYFRCIHQSLENYAFDLWDFSNKISLIVLHLISGVEPGHTKYGIKLRNLFELYVGKYANYNYRETLLFYYSYWTKFIKTTVKIDRVKYIFENEYRYQIKKYISLQKGFKYSVKYNDLHTNEFISLMMDKHVFSE